MKINKIVITSFRSITKLTIEPVQEETLVFCGSNNVGKTNILRAINVFFKSDINFFSANDIPYHVEHGSRGPNRKVDIKIHFSDSDYDYEITKIYIPPVADKDGQLTHKGRKKSHSKGSSWQDMESSEIVDLLGSYRVFFIEANKTDISEVIQEIFTGDVIPEIDRGKKYKKKTDLTNSLDEFQKRTKALLTDMEREMTENLSNFTSEVEGIKSQNLRIQITFPEVNTLRGVISRLVTLTTNDANDMVLEHKGSGIQKIILLAVMRYLSQKHAEENFLWLIDEPESFLQPSLQREVFEEFKNLSALFPVYITTHSPHFVDLSQLNSCHLITADREAKTYERKPSHKFMAVHTRRDASSGYVKVEKIKSHLGIRSNDSWNITPINILVEGEEDKIYITSLLEKLGVASPNIHYPGGVSKFTGFAQFLQLSAKDVGFTPKALFIFDHDDAGISEFKKIRPERLPNMSVSKLYVKRSDGKIADDLRYEIEDLIPPEIIERAANAYLKRRGYRALKKSAMKTRYQAARDSQCVLDVLTSFAQNANPEKESISFNDHGAKLFICKAACDIIDSMSPSEFTELLDNNPGLFAFLNEVKTFMET